MNNHLNNFICICDHGEFVHVGVLRDITDYPAACGLCYCLKYKRDNLRYLESLVDKNV